VKEILRRVSDAFHRVYREIVEMDTLDLVPRLTLILLILYAGGFWYLRIPMTILCTLGFLLRSLYRSAGFWLLVSVFMIWGNLYNWYEVDNHKFLITYWCLTIYVALLLPDPRKALAWVARVLIGLCFLFATVWKLLSPDFLDGTFFQFTLLTDPRFSLIAEHLGGTSGEQLFRNEVALVEMLRFDSRLDSISLVSGERVPLVAQAMTWWVFVVEAALAVAFFWPHRRFVLGVRNALLLGFAAATYSAANVVSFGWVLMVMGVAQTPPDHRRTRFLYVALFLIIQVYTIPWRFLATTVWGAFQVGS